MRRRPSIDRTRTGIDALDACLADDADVEIIHQPHLARKPRVLAKVCFGGENRLFRLADRARITREDLDPAGRAAGISAAAVKNIHLVILKAKH